MDLQVEERINVIRLMKAQVANQMTMVKLAHVSWLIKNYIDSVMMDFIFYYVFVELYEDVKNMTKILDHRRIIILNLQSQITRRDNLFKALKLSHEVTKIVQSHESSHCEKCFTKE